MAKAFGEVSIRRASRKINELSAPQVLRELKRRLPYRETRRYVGKVLVALDNYAEWDRVPATG